MILVTGAAGKTGRAVIRSLITAGRPVRALVHRKDQEAGLKGLGVADVEVGDMRLDTVMDKALAGTRAVYHMAPNVHPDEVSIARTAICAARSAAVSLFVFHSVLHPQTLEMPHHRRKLEVEDELLSSGLPFTILQPAAYMQNVFGYWPVVSREGVYAVPYSLEARLSLVDLADVAEVADKVLTESGHVGATYELAGPEALSTMEIAEILERQLGRPVRAERVSVDAWKRAALATGLDEQRAETLSSMFRYYDRHGLIGNQRVLEWLLGRPSRRFEDVTRRHDRSEHGPPRGVSL